MPVLEDEPRSALSFAASTALDLFWSLVILGDPPDGPHREMTEFPAARDAALCERVRTYWDDGASDWSELLVLANHGGTLQGPVRGSDLVAAVEAACESVPSDPLLRTESDSVRRMIWRRLALLQSDPDVRASYASLLSDVTSASEDHWRHTSQPLAERMAERCTDREVHGQSWKSLVGDLSRVEYCMSSVGEWIAPTDTLLVCFSTYGKSVVLDLPGVQLIGLRVTGASDAHERTQVLARRLRAMADPTRLAMLELLSVAPERVGALARHLEVSQPTVSNHVKLLRDAGLIRQDAVDRHNLLLDVDAVGELLDDVATSLRAPSQRLVDLARDDGAPGGSVRRA